MAVPTETVYGLAGSVFSQIALKKIFHIKKRPFFNPLIVHCATGEQMNDFHNISHPLLRKMLAEFSPGPLTFILNKTNKVDPLITAGQAKVGLRVPRHPLTLQLIKKTTALCAPSANLFSRLSPTRAGAGIFYFLKKKCLFWMAENAKWVLSLLFWNRIFREKCLKFSGRG